MERRIRKKWKLAVVGGCLFIFFMILGTCSGGVFSPFPCLYLSSFNGKVIDAITKEPIAKAAVLAVYYKSVATVAGSNSFVVDAQETLTDEKGELNISWKMRWFVLCRGDSRGKIIIFKPSYGVFPDHKQAKAVGENKSWPSPNKYIVYELPKLKTIKERKRNVIYGADP
ncbi:MAG: hypothetical protein KKB35_13405, partial [Proteobacteria bacterium]|nr:hypothetical protein [Pseudomonadota bacterium]